MIVWWMNDTQADMDATLELCHPGNEPSAGRWKDNVDAVRASGEHANNRLKRGTSPIPAELIWTSYLGRCTPLALPSWQGTNAC